MAWMLPPLPPKFEAALRDVRAQKPASRVAAAERLGRASDDERDQAISGLRTLSDDPDPAVRATAIAGLGMLQAEGELSRVLTALSDPVPEVRELSVVAAAQIGGAEAVSAIRGALASDAPEVRFQAVVALAELAPEQAPQAVLPLLQDPDEEVRTQAVAAVASLEVPHLSGHLAGALDDSSALVQLEAALALAQAGDARGERILLAALERRARPLEVMEALGRLGPKSAAEPLAQIARRFWLSPYLRAAAGAALTQLGDPRGEAALRKVLTGFRAEGRSYAVDLIRKVGAVSLCDELVRLSSRPRGVDPLVLVDALAAFSDREPEAKAALRRLAQGPGEVGQAAKNALRAPSEGAPPEPRVEST